jgi:uncharacterized protein (UPF0128 family)
VEYLYIFELGGVVEAESRFSVGVDEEAGVELALGLFDLVEAFNDDRWELLKGDCQLLLFSYQIEEMLIAS